MEKVQWVFLFSLCPVSKRTICKAVRWEVECQNNEYFFHVSYELALGFVVSRACENERIW